VTPQKKYQYISWFPRWHVSGFIKAKYGMSLIYDWYLCLGFWEIRKWHELKDGDIVRYNQESGG